MTVFSTPENIERSCTGKKRYATAEEASAVAAQCTEKRGTPLRVYSCTVCGGNHLSSLNGIVPKPGWRPAAKSQREIAKERKEERRRR